ncbi:MAG: hypothetical protein ACR2IP_14610 [Solirubrobacteraceae bacterium]
MRRLDRSRLPRFLRGRRTERSNQPAFLEGRRIGRSRLPPFLRGRRFDRSRLPPFLRGVGTDQARWATLLGGLVLVALIVVLIASGGGPDRVPAPEATPQERHAGLQSIFQADTQLHADPAGTLDILRKLGVDRVRVFVPWSAIAPAPMSAVRPGGFDPRDPASYPPANWAIYDAIVRDAAARRIGLDFTLTGLPPLWAAGRRAPKRGGPYPQWRPSVPAYGAFVRAIATRYGGTYTPAGSSSRLPRVSFWAIWNEPNYGPDLAPQAIHHSTVEVSPRLYRGLLDAAWSALRATGHGRDKILIGELAPRGITTGDNPGNFSGMVPLRFLRALYCVGASYRPLRGAAASARGCPGDAAGSAAFARLHPALFKAGGFADHPYPQESAPNLATGGEPDYADLPVLHRLEAVLDTLQRVYGSHTRFPIYSTEYGYRTDPPETGAIAPALAAYYLNWAEYLSWRDSRVRSYDQYLLSDPAAGNFPSGLQFADGKPKPSFDAYRLALYLPVGAASPGEPLEVWGHVRAARYARRATGRPQLVEIQFERGSSGGFQTVKTLTVKSAYGYFDVRQAFASSGTVRLAWSDPGGSAVLSRSASVTIR